VEDPESGLPDTILNPDDAINSLACDLGQNHRGMGMVNASNLMSYRMSSPCMTAVVSSKNDPKNSSGDGSSHQP
jgi:hypothetical protein